MFLMPGSRARPRAKAYDDLPAYQINAAPTSANDLIITVSQSPGTPAPFMKFRDANVANGDPVYRLIPNGATFRIASANTMGAANGVPFRLWIVGFDNGGGIAPGAINCLTLSGGSFSSLTPLDESAVQSPTGGNGGSSTGTFYATQGLTNRPYRILGYLEWSSGLATAGTWNIKPTKTQLFGPGIKKPGDLTGAMLRVFSTSQTSSTTSTFSATALTGSISMTSAANIVRYGYTSSLTFVTGGEPQMQMFRGSTAIGLTADTFANAGSGSIFDDMFGTTDYDVPSTSGSVTYTVKLRQANGSTTVTQPATPGGGASMFVEEIMA